MNHQEATLEAIRAKKVVVELKLDALNRMERDLLAQMEAPAKSAPQLSLGKVVNADALMISDVCNEVEQRVSNSLARRR